MLPERTQSLLQPLLFHSFFSLIPSASKYGDKYEEANTTKKITRWRRTVDEDEDNKMKNDASSPKSNDEQLVELENRNVVSTRPNSQKGLYASTAQKVALDTMLKTKSIINQRLRPDARKPQSSVSYLLQGRRRMLCRLLETISRQI